MPVLTASKTDVAAATCDHEPQVDFVVVDVETACSRVSSICQTGIVGFRDGSEVLAYETPVDPCDEFSSFNTRIGMQMTFSSPALPYESGDSLSSRNG